MSRTIKHSGLSRGLCLSALGLTWLSQSGCGSQGDVGQDDRATSAQALSIATQLDSGFGHSCLLRPNGQIKCWGQNNFGQLGLGDTNNRGDNAGEMGAALPPVDLGTGKYATSLALGNFHSCALLNDGSVKCWGYGGLGALGQGDAQGRGSAPNQMGDNLAPIRLGATAAMAITAGGNHTCALLVDRTVKCWGGNSRGQLGYGDIELRGIYGSQMGNALPVVDLPGPATAIAAGGNFTCAIIAGDDVYCWGANDTGQLGVGDTLDRGDEPGEMGSALPRTRSHGGTNYALRISAGDTSACVLAGPNERARCWGRNTWGQLGQGTSETIGDDEYPKDYPWIRNGGDVSDVAAGTLHSCVVRKSGAGGLRCFGRNAYGQLGYGDIEDRGDEPNEMGPDLPDVPLGGVPVAVSAGLNFSCGLLLDGSVKCWGVGNAGQLGNGSTATLGDQPGEVAQLTAIDLGF